MDKQGNPNDEMTKTVLNSDDTPEEIEATDETLRLFISHPHEYRQIADALRKAILSWSGGEVHIYQSSEAYAEGPIVGGPLREEIKRELDASDVVLVVYVTIDQAGSCMFEAGIAYGASTKKRLVVFQCGDKIPWAFRADLFVTISSDDIEKFTRDFHLSDQFFPNRKKPLFPRIPHEVIRDRSTQLYNELCATRPPSLHAPQKIDRWVSITASLTEDLAREISDAANKELSENNNPLILQNTKVEARKSIEKHGIITKYTITAPQHFGMNDFRDEDTKLYNIYMRWRQMMRAKKANEYLNYDWWNEICDQMTLAIANWRAQEVEIPLKSAHEEKTWYLPILTSAIYFPLQKKWDFTFHFVRIPEDSQFIKVGRINKE